MKPSDIRARRSFTKPSPDIEQPAADAAPLIRPTPAKLTANLLIALVQRHEEKYGAPSVPGSPLTPSAPAPLDQPAQISARQNRILNKAFKRIESFEAQVNINTYTRYSVLTAGLAGVLAAPGVAIALQRALPEDKVVFGLNLPTAMGVLASCVSVTYGFLAGKAADAALEAEKTEAGTEIIAKLDKIDGGTRGSEAVAAAIRAVHDYYHLPPANRREVVGQLNKAVTPHAKASSAALTASVPKDDTSRTEFVAFPGSQPGAADLSLKREAKEIQESRDEEDLQNLLAKPEQWLEHPRIKAYLDGVAGQAFGDMLMGGVLADILECNPRIYLANPEASSFADGLSSLMDSEGQQAKLTLLAYRKAAAAQGAAEQSGFLKSTDEHPNHPPETLALLNVNNNHFEVLSEVKPFLTDSAPTSHSTRFVTGTRREVSSNDHNCLFQAVGIIDAMGHGMTYEDSVDFYNETAVAKLRSRVYSEIIEKLRQGDSSTLQSIWLIATKTERP